MDFSKYYKKLPQRLQNSEKFLYYAFKFAKFLRSLSKPKKQKNNTYLNFLLKSTNIEVTGPIRDVQLISIELLKFIDQICEKYNLDYILCYGTLLGAVRHKGFIPWDDDLDIIMMRKDYNKLIEVFPDEINKYDFLKKKCGLTKLKNFNENLFENTTDIYDSQYEDYFFKIEGYKQRFLQFACLKPFVKIDIFPFDYVKEDSIKEYNEKYISQKYLFMKKYQEKDFSFDKELDTIFNKLGLTIDETSYIGEGVDCTLLDDFGAFNTDWIYPIKTIKFENHYFKCPNKPHELLKLWYGDSFMEIPSEIDMHDFTGYNDILFDYDSNELDKAFKETLKELKIINDNFK